jgi:hypothetical protein
MGEIIAGMALVSFDNRITQGVVGFVFHPCKLEFFFLFCQVFTQFERSNEETLLFAG